MLTHSILAHWDALAGVDPADAHAVKAIDVGLINKTYVVNNGQKRAIVQRLNPIFPPIVHQDIEAVTRHLRRHGMTTPLLWPTTQNNAQGHLFADVNGEIWRVMDYIAGRTHTRLRDVDLAKQAGALVGRFHRALHDFVHTFANPRGNVHDTPKHLANLQKALQEHQEHRLYQDVSVLAESLLEQAKQLPNLDHLPKRPSHGDLKISNLLFDEHGAGLCLIDLDTLSSMIWPFEMGDALRSWCNPGGEDEGAVHFDLSLFSAAIEGYAEQKPNLTRLEIDSLIDGVRTICLELSARFLADALQESYFGFDASRFPARGEHNLVRARSQWALYRSVTERAEEAAVVVRKAFGISSPVPMLSHVDTRGNLRMVDVSAKAETERSARAEGLLIAPPAVVAALRQSDGKKGDAIAAARLAGVMAAKRTGELIPLCHPLPLTHVTVELFAHPRGIAVAAETRCIGRTGVEMEALTAATLAMLTLYDMGKAADKGMSIEQVRLVEKQGGKSGLWTCDASLRICHDDMERL